MSERARAAAGEAIAQAVLALPAVRRARTVAAYVAMADEVPTAQLMRMLADAHATVLLPVLAADDSLSWRPLTSVDDLAAGRRGGLEPRPQGADRTLDEADVVVVPGLCFDHRGNRLGRGGGSYDRALSALPSATTTIALAYDFDVVDDVPVDPHDHPVLVIVTPTRVIVTDEGGT